MSATTTLSSSQAALRAAVAAAFGTSSPMLAVVACESHYRQFDAQGDPLISPTDDVGVMQINIPTWAAQAKALGLNIYTSPADNIAMGIIILKAQGFEAWTCKA